MYLLNVRTKECKIQAIPDDIMFHPVGIPPDARSLGEVVIGSNAGAKIGVTVDIWSGTSPRGNGAGSYSGVCVILMVCFFRWSLYGCLD